MDSISTGLLKIVIEDAGGTLSRSPSGASGTSSKGGSYDPSASLRAAPSPPPQPVQAQAPQQRPAPPQAPAPSQKPLPDPSLEDKIAAILKDPGAKQTLGKNTSAAEVAKMGPAFIDLLYGEIARGRPAAPVAASPGKSDAELDELKKQTAALEGLSQQLSQQPSNTPYGLPSAAAQVTRGDSSATSGGAFQYQPPKPDAPPVNPYGLPGGASAQVTAGGPLGPGMNYAPVKYGYEGMDTFGKNIKGTVSATTLAGAKEKAIEESGGFVTKVGAPEGAKQGWSGKPIAKVVARPVSDEEKSRDQWKPENLAGDLKNYLPNSITSKFDKMGSAYKAASAEAGAKGAGMAGRVAAGASEAVMAAGPVAAFAAVGVAAHLAAKANQKAADAIEGMGRQAERFAKNDHLGMFNAAVDGAKETLREIPIIGDYYASRIALAVAPINAFTGAVNGFVARGKELAGYSGPLAGANARADIRSLQGDLKEADKLGPALARLTDVQSRAEEELRNLLLPIKENVVKFLAMIAETGLDIWEFGKPILEKIGNDIQFLVAVAEKALPIIADPAGLLGLEKLIGKIKGAFEGRSGERKQEDLMVDWLKAADALGRDPWTAPFWASNDGPAQQQIAGPMFPGFGGVLGM